MLRWRWRGTLFPSKERGLFLVEMQLSAAEMLVDKEVGGMGEDEQEEGDEERDQDGGIGGEGKGGGESGKVGDGGHVGETDKHRRGLVGETREGAMLLYHLPR